MESMAGCLKKVEQKFLEMQTEKENWHTKCLSFEAKVWLLKEQNQSTMQANKMCERILLDKIQGLKEQIQLIGAKEKEIITKRELEVKQDAKMTKWKVLTLE